MAKSVTIAVDPITRIEGHLKAEVVIKDGVVIDAKLTGGMYRGFEALLQGRDPRDATQITQRLCGVCPTAHATASSRALNQAFKVLPPDNGRITNNLMLSANFLQSHILHFYHLSALDFADGPNRAPFQPRFKGADLRLPKNINDEAVAQYIEALEVRRTCHEMVALFGGRMPHVHGQVVGGVTEKPSKKTISEYKKRFKKVKAFVQKKYVPVVYTIGSYYKDLFEIGQGNMNCMCYDAFPMDEKEAKFLLKSGVYVDGKDTAFDMDNIIQEVKHSWYTKACGPLPVEKGKTIPSLDKKGAYSFVKAPRYDDKPVEVGPLARMWVNNIKLSPMGRKSLKKDYAIEAKNIRDLGNKAFSVMGRHVARAEEAWFLVQAIEGWLKQVEADGNTYTPSEIPVKASGAGLLEAPRGSLLHYIDIKDSKIASYQLIAATLWNTSPRDDRSIPGPLEQALIGCPVPDASNPMNVERIIRSFDP